MNKSAIHENADANITCDFGDSDISRLGVGYLRGRSQLSTFMKAYTAYARGEGDWDHRTLSPRKSTFICNHWQCIIKYCTCLECGQYAHICRSFMYNNTFEALFLTSKCTKRDFLWTQTVAPHRGFCKAAQRRYRIFSTWADSSKDLIWLRYSTPPQLPYHYLATPLTLGQSYSMLSWSHCLNTIVPWRRLVVAWQLCRSRIS